MFSSMSLPIFIISLYRSCSLNTVFLRTILALFFAFTSLSLPIFIISSCPRCYETGSVFFAMYISFRVILLYLLFILILFHWPCSSFLSKGTITISLAFASCHSLYLFLIFIISIYISLTFLNFVFLGDLFHFFFSLFFYFLLHVLQCYKIFSISVCLCFFFYISIFSYSSNH